MKDDALEALATELRETNPDKTFVVDEGAVWLRVGGTDYGVYSRAVNGVIVKVLENGVTVVHRPTPQEVKTS